MGTTAKTYRVEGYSNATALVVAHIRGLRGETLAPGDLSRITYSVYKLGNNGTTASPVSGHEEVDLVLSAVFFELDGRTYMSDGNMVVMDVNFEHQIDNTMSECFPERNARYLVRYNFYPVSGFVSPIQYILEAQ